MKVALPPQIFILCSQACRYYLFPACQLTTVGIFHTHFLFSGILLVILTFEDSNLCREAPQK